MESRSCSSRDKEFSKVPVKDACKSEKGSLGDVVPIYRHRQHAMFEDSEIPISFPIRDMIDTKLHEVKRRRERRGRVLTPEPSISVCPPTHDNPPHHPPPSANVLSNNIAQHEVAITYSSTGHQTHRQQFTAPTRHVFRQSTTACRGSECSQARPRTG
jgi:hypothetical protein